MKEIDVIKNSRKGMVSICVVREGRREYSIRDNNGRGPK